MSGASASQAQDHALRYLYLLSYSACSTLSTHQKHLPHVAELVHPQGAERVSLSALLLGLAKNNSDIFGVLQPETKN